MTRITITADDRDIDAALARVVEAGKHPRPLLKAIGETLADSTKRRFRTGTSPEGQPWAPNSAVTVERYLSQFSGSFAAKRPSSQLIGSRRGLSARGTARLAAKKPLIGETRSLSGNIVWQLAGNDAVEVGSPMIYAGVQQFGAKMGEFGRYSQISRRSRYGEKDFRRHAGTKKGFPLPWGDIPARPFLGISQADRAAILELVGDYLGGD